VVVIVVVVVVAVVGGGGLGVVVVGSGLTSSTALTGYEFCHYPGWTRMTV